MSAAETALREPCPSSLSPLSLPEGTVPTSTISTKRGANQMGEC